jgi:rSAM/selenodomain-associated transferase 2
MRLAIVMPVLDEARTIEAALAALQRLRERGARLIVVDGGSADGTAVRARAGADLVITASPGRARQMNAGAACVGDDRDVLLFLHADTRLPDEADRRIAAALDDGGLWGRFDARIDGRSPLLPLVSRMMNLRSRLTGICTGDQAVFARCEFFVALGGFVEQPLMEDIEFCRRARARSRPRAIRAAVVTSGRRWDQRGVWRTIVLMWSLRWRYFWGADPATLARSYREVR